MHAALSERYAGERFVRVMPLCDLAALDAGYFDVQACNDTNRCELFVFANANQAILMARLDNLGKGASGAAVQSMNVHLGIDEGPGLVAEPASASVQRLLRRRAVVIGIGIVKAEAPIH